MPARSICVVILLAAGLSGCAVRTEYLNLSYPPEVESDYASLWQEIGDVSGSDSTPPSCTLSLAVRDDRADSAMIGYTAFNLGTSRVNLASRNSVAAWVHDAFDQELSALGYDVTLGMWEEANPTADTLRVSIETTVAECYINCMATVSLTSVHTSPFGPSKAFVRGEGNSMLGGWTHVGVAETALQSGLQRAVRISLILHDLASPSEVHPCRETGAEGNR